MNDLSIRFHCPSIGEEEIREVVDTMRSGWLTTGPRTARFERELAGYVEAPHAIALNSATAALHLALLALKIGPGDEVITTPMTFCATVQAILHVGAIPVLADIGPDGNIDPGRIERFITPRTRAILPVHLAGLPCDMSAIWSIAAKHRLAVIEDAAHAIGARYRGRPVGAGALGNEPASDAVAFSFYATKNLTTGEGGMLTTYRSDVMETVRTLALHGTTHDAWDRYTAHGSWHYEVVAHGYKYNLSDIQSAIGIHQLHKLDGFLETRARYAAIYHRMLGGLDAVELPSTNPGCRHAWHLYILRLNLDRLKVGRDDVIRELHERGIGTSVHFIPIPLHPFFARLSMAGDPCQRALDLYPRILSLPLYPAMTEDQVRYVAESVRAVLERAHRARFVVPAAAVSAAPLQPSDVPCVPEGSI
jgi:dTDP-4-amino-4,6-dideoxygalactose transaminase